MKRLFLFLVLGVILISSTSVFADISLDNYRERLDISPGGTIQGTIAVRNFSNKNIKVKAEASDFIYIAPFDGKKEFDPAGENPYSCKDWVNVIPDEFEIPALETRKVAYTIKAPSSAKGGYYGVIFFESVGKKMSSGTGLLVRVGRTLLLETKGSKKDLKIRSVSAQQDTITGEFQNSCGLVLISKPTFIIMDAKGAAVDRGEIKEFYLPPESKLPFKIKVSDKIPQGSYSIELNFSFFGRGALIKEIAFSKDETGQVNILKVEE